MERVYPAVLAEIMLGALCIPLIKPKMFFAFDKLETVLWNARNYGVLLAAKAAIAGKRLCQINFCFEFHRAAVT